jgi:PIN domain nuclease of toxin-antitoxin system
VVLDTHVLLY